jgi:hypothetical protein
VSGKDQTLVRELQRQVRAVEDDLRAQADRLPDVKQRLESDYADAAKRGRTAESWTAWRDAQATQAAVSWVLGCVFVRFCEDNELTDRRWLAGIGHGLDRAVDAQAAWIQAHPRDNERGWLREAFGWLRSTRAGAALFPGTDFVWWWDLSADAAAEMLDFFRRRGSNGELAHPFDAPGWDTRFLGDLYQDLSEAARNRYALLQTPEFVEEFILDLTLDPALDEFGIEKVRMIDPACGSGHFLLGSFRRLLDTWSHHAPAMDSRARVQRALDGVYGVDVNDGAAAIAKFRLMVAALRAAGATRLDAPDTPAFTLHVATGDSLIWGAGFRQTGLYDEEDALAGQHYAWEDIDQHPHILDPGRYHVVVANPPYITVKDKALNAAYRERYQTCSGKYAMSVPFAELLFRLAIRDDEQPGYVGQITSNSFMKREFGKKLIEDFYADPRYEHAVTLTHVIDTSGAYIPGHGTPTVILIGRRRYARGRTVRAVLGIRGEPSAPPEPAKGLVWASIVEKLARPGAENEYVSVTDLPRERLASHPWSLAGGGADELKSQIDGPMTETLGSKCVDRIGFAGVPGIDELFFIPADYARRRSLEDGAVRSLIAGISILDWTIRSDGCAIAPYSSEEVPLPLSESAAWAKHLWPLRVPASAVLGFGGVTRAESGRPWWAWHQWSVERHKSARLLGVRFLATHNHAAVLAGSSAINHAVMVVRMDDAHSGACLAASGVLNSSTACFWLKQVCHNKGSTVDQRGARQTTVEWENFYEFTGTKLQEFPLPTDAPSERARRLDALAQRFQQSIPAAVCAAGVPTRSALDEAHAAYASIRAEMIAVQEELDWEVYRLYGVLDDDFTYSSDDLPVLALGERAFEIVLAQKLAAGEADTQWFARHRSTPITEVPERWPADYRNLVQRRIGLIEKHPLLHLIERCECKRRWSSEPWEDMVDDALRGWLLDRLEAPEWWLDANGPRTLSIAQLADVVRADADFRSVLDLYVGRPDYDLAREIGRLVKDEGVPYLATRRYKPSGMRKRAEWERTWTLQRQEDTENKHLDIAVPPKYKQSDFRATSSWRARGKLDVPKERFLSYPGAERSGDPTQVIGWAGWDHAEQAQALARLVLDRQERDGWSGEQLAEPLAGLAELEPWLHQWHADPDPAYGGSPASFYTTFLDEQAHAAGLTRADLRPLAALPEPEI